MTDPIGIEIRNLYKIFGTDPQAHVEAVRAGMTKAELQARHGHVLGLSDINISVAPGSIQVIMGLSGSGKSTLIRHINRLIEPTVGEILVEGRDVVGMPRHELREFRRHKTAMVFQKFGLLPHRPVLDNVAYGLEVQGIAQADRYRTAMRWIERVGLSGFEKSYPSQLSGGMQQRVGLARALANDAPILLMDEAYSALDPLIRYDMQTVLLDLQQEVRKTIVFITHDLDEALRLGDKIAILRDGAMEQVGDGQEIVLRPANAYIAEFVREVNRGRIIEARTIAAPAAEGRELPGFAVKARSRLDLVARRMTKAGVSEAQVRDGDRLVGIIDLPSILEAMVNPADAASDD